MMKQVFLALLLVSGATSVIRANPGQMVMPPSDWEPIDRIALGELITTIQTTDGTLEAHKGAITPLTNGSYSVNINYILDDVVYRVTCVINPDGTGSINTAGEALFTALAARPALYQAVNQQYQSYQAALPSIVPSSDTPMPIIPQLSACGEAWISLAVSVVTKSWLGGLWALYKVISACF